MSGNRRTDEKDNKEEERGWTSTFFKIAGAAAATAAVVGGLYSILNYPQAEVAPYGMQQPDPEVVILKVDSSLLRGKESAGCGGYLCSASQKWICGFVQKLDPTTKEDETEREAILRGLIRVKEKGRRKVMVKSDILRVILTTRNVFERP